MAEKTDDRLAPKEENDGAKTPPSPGASAASKLKKTSDTKKEIGGPKGPEPTRYGDWEKGGRCIDF